MEQKGDPPFFLGGSILCSTDGFPWWFGSRWFGFRLDLPENESGIVTFSGYPETRMRKPTKRPGPHQGKPTYLERQVSYFLGNFTPKTSN